MRALKRMLLLMAVLAAAAPVLALPEGAGPSAEYEANRQRLQRLRATDPARYERLKEDLHAFADLNPEQQERMRRLDREVREEEPAVQAHLLQLMDRYVTWYERLPAADQNAIKNAPDANDRLAVIRQIREREWEEHLPRARRDQLAVADPEKRAGLLAEWREQEAKRRKDWDRALGGGPAPEDPQHHRPKRPGQLPGDAMAFVNCTVKPQLTAAEADELKKAEGKWPDYPRTLMPLVEKYPAPLPGPAIGPCFAKDLPGSVRQKVFVIQGTGVPRWAAERDKLKAAEGKWPDFAIAVTEVLRKDKQLPQELGPCKPGDFGPPFEAFIKEVQSKLDDTETKKLKAAETRWPDYPRELKALAAKHNVPVPAAPLPGPPDFWTRMKRAGN
jgi:hypothetical protein